MNRCGVEQLTFPVGGSLPFARPTPVAFAHWPSPIGCPRPQTPVLFFRPNAGVAAGVAAWFCAWSPLDVALETLAMPFAHTLHAMEYGKGIAEVACSIDELCERC